MSEAFASPFFGVAVSVAAYALGVAIQRKTRLVVCNPLVIATLLIIALLVVFDIPYEDYNQGGAIINLFLGPATACLAVTIYSQIDLLKKNLLPILAGCVAGTATAVFSILGMCRLFGLDSQLTISGYNLQTGIRTKVSADVTESGEIVLNARLFGDIIRRMPDDVVTFSADDRQTVHLSCGDANFDILGLSAADYPDLPEVEDEYSVSIQQKTLRAMIEETAFAVSTNESRPVHTGALFEISDKGLTMVAVDGFRLAIRREPLEKIEGGAFSFVAPGSALNEVKGICADSEDLASVTLGKRHILFEVGDTELICRRLEGEFLDYKNAIPRKNPISVIADTKSLIESIDRVSVVISDKLKSPVRCLFEQDRVLLSAKTGNGEAKDVCRLSGDGNGLEIGFNNRYLMEALRYAPADTVKIELNTGVSPAIIVPVDGEENFLYMVLPVRLKSAE